MVSRTHLWRRKEGADPPRREMRRREEASKEEQSSSRKILPGERERQARNRATGQVCPKEKERRAPTTKAKMMHDGACGL